MVPSDVPIGVRFIVKRAGWETHWMSEVVILEYSNQFKAIKISWDQFSKRAVHTWIDPIVFDEEYVFVDFV